MSEDTPPRVAVFRPDDERMADARELLGSLGVEPVADSMLEISPTGRTPRSDADVVVLTSKTGVELAADRGWDPGDARVCAIGPATADALQTAGYRVDLVPDEYSSSGLVALLADDVAGRDVDVARSDHGSDVLLTGLREAGADVTETVLYELRRPEGAGRSTDLAATGALDGALFTSSLTVEHFLAAAADRDQREAVVAGLERAVVGAIGEPTAATARDHGIAVDVVPASADFERLARATVERIRARAT